MRFLGEMTVFLLDKYLYYPGLLLTLQIFL